MKVKSKISFSFTDLFVDSHPQNSTTEVTLNTYIVCIQYYFDVKWVNENKKTKPLWSCIDCFMHLLTTSWKVLIYTENFRSISLRIIGIKILPHKLFGIIVENEIKLIANAETAQFR